MHAPDAAAAALLGLASAFTLGRASLALADAPTDRRFVVVILRGALDGLSAVVPYGDAALAGLRGEIVPPAPGQDGGMLDLGGFYGLHPALANLHAMYRAGEALAVHAVAGPYRVRSHFEAQDCLESGADHRMTSGWLNRAIGSACRAPARTATALAIGVVGAAAAARSGGGGELGAARHRRTRRRSLRAHRRAEPGRSPCSVRRSPRG